jgi:cobalt/nickel transport system ATP-binding protein
MDILKLEDVHFSYPDGSQALNGVELSIDEGDFVAISGGNGCGKTTLLKHLNGLFKPTQGKVYFKGKELGQYNPQEIFQKVGFVFQDPNDQLFAPSVEQDVAFGPLNLGLEQNEIMKRVNYAVELTGIKELLSKHVHDLSFGQKQRVAIAGVLAMEPEVLVLDEPTSALDPQGIDAVMAFLKKLNQEGKITIVMATHEIELVPLYIKKLVILKKGRIITRGRPEEVFACKECLEEGYLKPPVIVQLMSLLRKEGLSIQKFPLTIEEAKTEILRLLQNLKS